MKVKKSLLIVPAMATMLLAAAGSVGGTVAWFSANTAYNTDISTFKVVRLDGDLNCSLVAGIGTTITDSKVRVAADSELTHGSFDHTTGNVYVQTVAPTAEIAAAYGKKATIAANGGALSDGSLVAGTYVSGTTHTVYYAVTWGMNFTYQLPGGATSGSATNLYFNLNDLYSKMTPTHGDDSSGSITKHTSIGFRIAFYPNTDSNTTSGNQSNTRVWADLQSSASCTYVSGAAATSSYAAGTLLDKDNTTVIAEGASGSKDADICLGQFKAFNGSGASFLGFTCVAWFEGTDINVINASTFDTIATSLGFYTRPSSN